MTSLDQGRNNQNKGARGGVGSKKGKSSGQTAVAGWAGLCAALWAATASWLTIREHRAAGLVCKAMLGSCFKQRAAWSHVDLSDGLWCRLKEQLRCTYQELLIEVLVRRTRARALILPRQFCGPQDVSLWLTPLAQSLSELTFDSWSPTFSESVRAELVRQRVRLASVQWRLYWPSGTEEAAAKHIGSLVESKLPLTSLLVGHIRRRLAPPNWFDGEVASWFHVDPKIVYVPVPPGVFDLDCKLAPQQLTTLLLRSGSAVTELSLGTGVRADEVSLGEPLAGLTKLTGLRVYLAQLCDPGQMLGHWQRLVCLENLRLEISALPEAAPLGACLACLTHLTRLELDLPILHDATLIGLGALARLSSLELRFIRFSGETMEHCLLPLRDLRIEFLSLSSSEHHAGLAFETLCAHGADCDAPVLPSLRTCVLRGVILAQTSLAGLPALTQLDLHEVYMDDDDAWEPLMAALARANRLQTLRAQGALGLRDEAILALLPCTSLRHLSLCEGAEISAAVLARLAHLEGVRISVDAP